MECKKKQIKVIILNFEFKKVWQAMVATNWEWADIGTPSIREMKVHAAKLLESVSTDTMRGSGGFEASCDKDGDLCLNFKMCEIVYSDYA